jgi:hypothetical protein
VRVYLDNCCFNRPFDDQRQTRVRIEAEAKLVIQGQIRSGVVELAWSYILDFENAANPFDERRTAVNEWRKYAMMDVEETPMILQNAKMLAGLGLKAKGALHLACAIDAECQYFVTTDDRILRRGKDVQDIILVDPTALVRELNL